MKGKLVLGFVVLSVFGFSSFPSYAQSSSIDQRIFGTWIFIRASNWGNDTGDTATLVFNPNGSGTHTVTFQGEATQEKNFTYGFSLDGTIYIFDGRIKSRNGQAFQVFFEFNSGYTPYFSPDGKTLIIDNKVYRRR